MAETESMATVYPAARNLFTAVTYTRSRNCSLPIHALRPPEDITRRRRRRRHEEEEEDDDDEIQPRFAHERCIITGQGWTRTGAEGIWGKCGAGAAQAVRPARGMGRRRLGDSTTVEPMCARWEMVPFSVFIEDIPDKYIYIDKSPRKGEF